MGSELHVVAFSTGLSSAIVLDEVQKRHGKENTIALFTDTLWEDKDNYRFGNQVIEKLGANLLTMADGRTPEYVWYQTSFLVGAGGSTCTTKLKIDQTKKFLEANKEKDITLYFGINADEDHRTYALENRYGQLGVKCEFPLCEEPMHHLQMVETVEKKWGIKKPRMYDLGFSHANCGGRCVKAGFQHYRLLLNVWPDKFREMELIEWRFQKLTGTDITILRAKKGDEEIRVPLSTLREKELQQLNFCFSETPCECHF